MKIDFFGVIRNDGIVRLMSVVEFVGDGLDGQVGYASPDYFFWGEHPGEVPGFDGKEFCRELRLLGSALIADRYHPHKHNPYKGHVVKIVVRHSGIDADFSMVESLNLDGWRELNGAPIKTHRKQFGSVMARHINLEALA